MDKINEIYNNAEIALSNQQYDKALALFKEALKYSSNDIYVLSRCGAICVLLKKFKEALSYFETAIELDPSNGDNLFNYANACFYNEEYKKAFEFYVKAESIGCSKDTMSELYYKMAMLCSIRKDFKSALVYFDKCEANDSKGTVSINTRVISEKLKIYMAMGDYDNAEVCSEQLVAVKPTVFRSYMILFNILMAHSKFKKAEKVLNDAQNYAQLDENSQVILYIQKANLYLCIANHDKENKNIYLNKAKDFVIDVLCTYSCEWMQTVNLIMSLAEIYQMQERFEDAVNCLMFISNGPQSAFDNNPSEEVERIIRTIINNEVEKVKRTPGISISHKLEKAQEERVKFMLISVYIALKKYQEALDISAILKHSDTDSYAYYGLYTETFALRKLKGNNDADVQRKSAEAIAFFKNKMLTDHSDTSAVIFRARIYADQGNFERAKELAELLSDIDKNSILEYISSVE